MFYTRYLFRIKRLQFTPPGVVDAEFYQDIKDRLVSEPTFKFESEVIFWQTYKYILIVFMTFIVAISLASLFYYFKVRDLPYLYGILAFVIILLARPSIYFVFLMVNYFKYVKDEKRFHIHFKKAVAQSPDFEIFLHTFYLGEYAPKSTIKEYLFENDIKPIKEFSDSKGLAMDIAIYKFSNAPPSFVILSVHEEINKFIESSAGSKELKKGDKIRWVVKYQVELPCIFGNKSLKKLIDVD
jgi:hypothetical protein